MLWIVGLALILRAAIFPFADNKHGDSPMRALIAERLNLDPASAADPRTYCQFGPLHTTLMRGFLALDPVAPRSSRYLSLLAGLAVFLPFWRLARRLVPARAAALAALALALSPLHLQASTTAASESLYLLLMVACLERLLTALERPRALATYAVAGLLASLAAVTRYDAWLAFPMIVAAAWLFTRDRRRDPAPGAATAGPGAASRLPGLLIFSAVAALLPLAWVAWSARATDDPIFFAHYIVSDHAGLAGAVNRRCGPLLARARQLGIWSVAFVAAMGLPLMLGAAVALRRFRALPPASRIVVVAALAPPALYLAKGLLFLSFEPLPRFALIPGTLLLPLGAQALLRRWTSARARLLVAAASLLFSALALAAAWSGPRRIWSGAESLGPITRLDAEDRELASYLSAHRRPGDRVFIEPVEFSDIVIAAAARVPAELTVSLAITRSADRTVAETLAHTGARWLAAYDGVFGGAGDVGAPEPWARRLAADWPARSLRFGHWKLIRGGAGD